MSYGDSASELIKELSRAVDSLPNYDDVAVREVVEECINLEAKNREAYNSEELSRLIAGAEDQTSILGRLSFLHIRTTGNFQTKLRMKVT